eukprot:403352100
MKRANPASSKLLQKKWRDKDYVDHLARLNQIRPALQLAPPTQFTHLRSKAKKEQQLEDKYIEIERENKILLHKMQKILKNSQSQPTLQTQQNCMQFIIKIIILALLVQASHIGMGLVNQNSNMNSGEDKRSLNRDQRKRDLLRVTLENYEFLKRLNQKGSTYSVTKWEEEFKQKEKLLKSLSEFPQNQESQDGSITTLKLRKSQYRLPEINSTIRNHSISKCKQNKQIQQLLIVQKRANQTNATDRSRSNSGNRTAKLQVNSHKQRIIKIHEEMLIKITKNGNIVSPETEKFYSQKMMKKEYYDIHIYKTKDDYVFVSAMNERSSEIFLIELPKPKSTDVLASFNYDYHYLCDFLDIKKNRLVIMNPAKASKSKTDQQKLRISQGSASQDMNQNQSMPQISEDATPLKGVRDVHLNDQNSGAKRQLTDKNESENSLPQITSKLSFQQDDNNEQQVVNAASPTSNNHDQNTN